jgi:hypothetical protein
VKPTAPTTLLALAVIGGALMYAAELVLLRLGQPIVVPPITLAVALALLGVIIPVLAWPVRNVTRDGSSPGYIDPFYATRVLLVSKAGSLTASALTGGAIGVLAFLIGRAVIAWPQVLVTSLTLAGGILMLAGALLAERWCAIPPSDAEESSPAAEGEPA